MSVGDWLAMGEGKEVEWVGVGLELRAGWVAMINDDDLMSKN